MIWAFLPFWPSCCIIAIWVEELQLLCWCKLCAWSRPSPKCCLVLMLVEMPALQPARTSHRWDSHWSPSFRIVLKLCSQIGLGGGDVGGHCMNLPDPSPHAGLGWAARLLMRHKFWGLFHTKSCTIFAPSEGNNWRDGMAFADEWFLFCALSPALSVNKHQRGKLANPGGSAMRVLA